jgi:hypothetical protein
MPSLCVFSKQYNALVGWPDAISAHTFVNPEAYQTSFGLSVSHRQIKLQVWPDAA